MQSATQNATAPPVEDDACITSSANCIHKSVRDLMSRLPNLLLDADECGALRGAFLNLLVRFLDYELPPEADASVNSLSSTVAVVMKCRHEVMPTLLMILSSDSLISARLVALRAVFVIVRKLAGESVCATSSKKIDSNFNAAQLLEMLYVQALCDPSEQVSQVISAEWSVVVDRCLTSLSGRAKHLLKLFFFQHKCSEWLKLASGGTADAVGSEDLSGKVQNEDGDMNEAGKTATDCVLRTRRRAADMMAYLFCKLAPLLDIPNDDDDDAVFPVAHASSDAYLHFVLHSIILPHLVGVDASQLERQVACFFIAGIGKTIANLLNDSNNVNSGSSRCYDYIKQCLFMHGLYPELVSTKLILFKNVFNIAIKDMNSAALKLLRAAAIDLPQSMLSIAPNIDSINVLNFDQVRQLCLVVSQHRQECSHEVLEFLSPTQEAYEHATTLIRLYNRRYKVELCSAIVSLAPHVYLPPTEDRSSHEKLTTTLELPVKQALLIKPLIDAIKNETMFEHQILAADALASLTIDFIRQRVPGQTAQKVLKNVISMCCRCGETDRFPVLSNTDGLVNEWLRTTFENSTNYAVDAQHGMLAALMLDYVPSDCINWLETFLLRIISAETSRAATTTITYDMIKRRRRGSFHLIRRVLEYCADQPFTLSSSCSAEDFFCNKQNPLFGVFNFSGASNGLKQPNSTSDEHLMELIDLLSFYALLVKAIKLHPLLPVGGMENEHSIFDGFHQWFLRLAENLTTNWLRHRSTIVRHYAANLYATTLSVLVQACLDTPPALPWRKLIVCGFIVPLLSPHVADDCFFHYGLIEALHLFVLRADESLVLPLASLLVVPLMPRISSPHAGTRALASHCFSSLVKLLPLLATTNDNLSWFHPISTINSGAIAACNSEEIAADFSLELDTNTMQLVSNSAGLFQQLTMAAKSTAPLAVVLEDILVSPTKLRRYQEQGVSWLIFLQKLNLGGILCDDMGLGKTLQTLCAIAANITSRQKCPTLVVCPATLTLHWSSECCKFLDSRALQPVVITPTFLQQQNNESKQPEQTLFGATHLLIISYDTLRRFAHHTLLQSMHFYYVVLDEGHLVRNTRTKIYQTITGLISRSQHRLILTGTPVQNHVHELWSLFDFLMPGYLGTERQFQARYGKPIAQANCVESTAPALNGVRTTSGVGELEAGTLALEELHQRVLPFILRRLKSQVLTDLPPKLMQDYLCDLSELQRILYDDFQRSQMAREVWAEIDDEQVVDDEKTTSNFGVTFRAMHYLRQVCNHPQLVLKPGAHPRYNTVKNQFLSKNSATSVDDDGANFARLLDNIEHSGKLLALKDLLLSCGIGTDDDDGDAAVDETERHRALIFCQSRAMLELVERIVLRRELPHVKFSKLTGDVPVALRAQVVETFNNNCGGNLSCMLLTTSIGGLGLNLTGADTVIFVEHDWNPHRDLQAMDRAHRIGQKRIVTVYRLITKGTLEEKIMGLQKFKLFMADTIVNTDNADPLSSVTKTSGDELLDLFALSAAEQTSDASRRTKKRSPLHQTTSAAADGGKKRSLTALLENYNPENDYVEFDTDVFLKKLKPRNLSDTARCDL